MSQDISMPARERPLLDLIRSLIDSGMIDIFKALLESGLLTELINMLRNKPESERQRLQQVMHAQTSPIWQLIALVLECLAKDESDQLVQRLEEFTMKVKTQ